MPTPYVTIDLEKIEHNARIIVEQCRNHGIAVTGVTKGVGGHPDVARAMLRGGVVSIAESRIDSVRRLRDAGIDASIMLLSMPALSAVNEVVAHTDVSLNSELCVLEALGEAAVKRGIDHDVILMVDLGDLREGIWPDDVVPFVGAARQIGGIRIVGLGTNLSCFSGFAPTEENMSQLVELAAEIEKQHGLTLRWISGINSSGLTLVAAGRMPARINHARIGEAIVLGLETIGHSPWPGAHQDAFVLHAEVVELRQKPSAVAGERGDDAFGGRPQFEDRGLVRRALLNIGRDAVAIESLTPLQPGLRILGGSSSYLVVDVTQSPRSLSVGDVLAFSMSYGALLATMNSGYVEKRILSSNPAAVED